MAANKKTVTITSVIVTTVLALLQGLNAEITARAVEPIQLEMRETRSHNKDLLKAILRYQIEADRYLRGAIGNEHARPPELDKAAEEIRSLY